MDWKGMAVMAPHLGHLPFLPARLSGTRNGYWQPPQPNSMAMGYPGSRVARRRTPGGVEFDFSVVSVGSSPPSPFLDDGWGAGKDCRIPSAFRDARAAVEGVRIARSKPLSS